MPTAADFARIARPAGEQQRLDLGVDRAIRLPQAPWPGALRGDLGCVRYGMNPTSMTR
jgi:hypothetical protein